MPGILPMKVIKVGTSAQTRIAQACDRCRSKKIRCDGFRPCCSQCANVGFECKTSDKLSRRAFPRGYTESLEERVRALELEVRELKDLLDGKDEKIDMLSKVHSQRSLSCSPPPRRGSLLSSPLGFGEIPRQQDRSDLFKVQQSPFLFDGDNSDSYFVGTSNGRAFVDAFKRRIQEIGKPCSTFDVDCFFPAGTKVSVSPLLPSANATRWRVPPRLLSDQMVNIYFQEWAPLFPVIHRPTFLAIYEQYVSGAGLVRDKRSLAQLNLVFGIAAQANGSRMTQDIISCERQWQSALQSFNMEISLENLQCLILAQIFNIQKGDFTKVLHYKSLAVGISHRLGLHQSQKRFALGALTIETRKKVFWTLYTLDCFSAAALGLPKLLRDDDVHCEYPVDTDDEYVTEKGFQPTLPGEFTKISSALALFRGTRILSKVLEVNYPNAATQELSLRKIAALGDELDAWSDNLAPHLKLEFVQDKPSTNMISSRCPLLSLTYHYIRTLIHRPVVCANLGEKSSPSVVALASSSKRIIQILQLLDERNLSFSFCVNKNELVTLSGFGLLFQALDLDQEGKLMKDSQRTICTVIDTLNRNSAPGASEFRRLGCSMIAIRPDLAQNIKPQLHRSISAISTTSGASMSSQKQLQSLAARYTLATIGRQDQVCTSESRGASMSTFSTGLPKHRSGRKVDSPVPSASDSNLHSLFRSISKPEGSNSMPALTIKGSLHTPEIVIPNLDYFSFDNDPPTSPEIKAPTTTGIENDPKTTDWEKILKSLGEGLDDDQGHVFDWPHRMESLLAYPKHDDPIWSPDAWELTIDPSGHQSMPTAHSVISLSDESLTSGEEFSSVNGSTGSDHPFMGHITLSFSPESVDELQYDDFQRELGL